MAEKIKQLSLNDGDKAALIFVLIGYLNEQREDEDHIVHAEIQEIYQRLITL